MNILLWKHLNQENKQYNNSPITSRDIIIILTIIVMLLIIEIII